MDLEYIYMQTLEHVFEDKRGSYSIHKSKVLQNPFEAIIGDYLQTSYPVIKKSYCNQLTTVVDQIFK